MRLTFFLGIAAALAFGGLASAAEAVAAPPKDAVQTLACTGPFAKDTSEAKLKAAFGEKNVVYKNVGGPEGTDAYASVVFPDDPGRSIAVFWSDEEKREKPAALQVDMIYQDDQPDPWATPVDWATADGLKIGSAIEKVQKINGKAFELSGFDWDYGGNVIDWKEGKFAKPDSDGCSFSPTFSESGQLGDKAVGDVQIMSDDPDVLKGKVRIARLTLGYALPDEPQ